ncbi:hypothetical protein [Levilactobacillus namurensis]|uniref:hypothetical protein n=1 Tax=Levilactobacillus namurensis TaxID=380393 RepID=UPI0026F0FA4E|nr:hypothetical protein [Levilactobacillus namurensis]
MKNLLGTYLKSNGLTRNKVGRTTPISATTVQRSSDKDALTINPRVLWAISLLIDKTPGQVLDDLIKLEEENDMTTEEIVLLMNKSLKSLGADPLVTVEDLGQDADGNELEQVVVELDLKGDDDSVRFVINPFVSEEVRKYDVLQDLSYAMADYDHEADGDFYPTNRDDSEDHELIEPEYMGVSQESADYLYKLSSGIDKIRRG